MHFLNIATTTFVNSAHTIATSIVHSKLDYWDSLYGSTENAGPENGGPKKMQELKMQD